MWKIVNKRERETTFATGEQYFAERGRTVQWSFQNGDQQCGLKGQYIYQVLQQLLYPSGGGFFQKWLV